MRDLKIMHKITDRRESVSKYFTEVNKYNLLSTDQEVELAHRSRNGDSQATDKLIKANLRFVVSVAKQYQDPGIELQDLIQAGNLGIIEAAKRFDPTRGFKFISYAVWWIRQFINTEISNKRPIRLPQNKRQEISRTNKERELVNQNVMNGDFSEIGTIESVDISYVSKSLNDAMGENETVEDVLTNYQPGDEDKDLLNDELQSIFMNLFITRLNARESYILKSLFGIGCRPKFLEEIAEDLKLTRERARQIKDIGLKKLRKIEGLKQYFN